MRGLAEYVMSGRRQAVTIAVLFGLIPMLNLLSGAVVALVTLRKGLQEGFLVMLWALLPAGMQWLIGDTTPVFMLIGVVPLAYVLRRTQSWQKALLLATGFGLLLQMSLPLQQEYMASLRDAVGQMMAGQNLELPESAGDTRLATQDELVALLLSFYGAWHVIVFAGCLMVARWVQAMLYNPGGFRPEFHNLRFDLGVMAGILALVVAGVVFELMPLADWVPVLCMVPIFAGMAVIHSVVAGRKLAPSFLAMAYTVLLLMAPVIVVLGFVDSVIDIRRRMNKS